MLEPTSTIKLKLGINLNGEAQKFFTNTCYKHMDKYVPKDTGILRRVVRLEANSITYQSPYAHAQYVGIIHGSPVRNYTTPGTGPYWDKRMVSAEMKDIENEVQKFIEKRR